MLYKLDTSEYVITPVKRIELSKIKWKEKDLQKLLFEHIDRVIYDEELIVIAQSRNWQEEPDIMALDREGNLWIFELKAFESKSENLMQVIRYGQKFGQYRYNELNALFHNWVKEELISVHNKMYPDKKLSKEEINRDQKFVVMTNGLDYKTRRSIQYWKEKGLNILPWIYRLYQTSEKSDDVYIEFNTFRTKDDPLEDIEEVYHVVNTNITNNPQTDKDMISEKKAAAYFSPWKEKIDRIKKGDHVFLYRSRVGIVARGIANSEVQIGDYIEDKRYQDEEHYVKLRRFQVLENPITHAETVELSGYNRMFTTRISIDKESWTALYSEFTKRYNEQTQE